MSTEIIESFLLESVNLESSVGAWDYSIVNHEILEPGRVLRYNPVGEEIIVYALEGKVQVRTSDSRETITLDHPFSITGLSPYVIYNDSHTQSRVLIIRKTLK